MNVEFDKSFEKSLFKIDKKSIFPKIISIIIELHKADSLFELKNIKKLSGFKDYYRIKIELYRIGIERINKNTVRFITIKHRKDIYKVFP